MDRPAKIWRRLHALVTVLYTRTWRRRIGWFAVAGVLAYSGFAVGMFVVMCQPPERFGRIMAHVPMPALMALPFETMWNVARDGASRIGDEAPDFTLSTLDRKAQVRLGSFRGSQPVVLVFGSYT
jgi:hypothetical protein